MSSRLWLGIGAIALAGSIIWWRTHLSADDTAKPDSGSAAPAKTASGGDGPVMPPAPVSAPRPPPVVIHDPGTAPPWLPDVPEPQKPLPGGKTPAARFAAQPRDPSWASETESELRKRAAKLPNIQVTSAECKTTDCKLVIAGGPAAIASAIDTLGSAKGLRGWAQAMTLSEVTRDDSGSASLTAYVELARTRPGDGEDQ